MSHFWIRLLTVTALSAALATGPVLSAYANGSDNPAPPASDSGKGDKKGDKSSSIDDAKFVAGYRTAYTTIYHRNDYASAVEQLKALGHDDRAVGSLL